MVMVDVAQLLAQCRRQRVWLRTAESCTAGALAARLASVAGASDVLDRGWVVYSNQAKMDVLAVPPEWIRDHGAVSQQVVEAMAEYGADRDHLCVALSGIAGPGGGCPDKPVGTVWFAVAGRQFPVISQCCRFEGDRAAVQAAAVDKALAMLWQMVLKDDGVTQA